MMPVRTPAVELARAFAAFGGRRLLAAIGLMVAGTLAEGVGILLLVPVILGTVAPGHGGGALLPMLPREVPLPAMLALFALLAVLRSIIVLMRERLTSRLQVGFVEAVRLRLAERLTGAPWAQVSGLSHARIVQALSVEIHQIGIGVNSLMAATAAAVIAAGMALMAMAVAPFAALTAFAVAGLSYLPTQRMLGRIRQLGEDITQRHFGMTENAIDFLAGLKTVAAERTGPAWLEQQQRLSDVAVDDRVAFASLHARARELSVGLTAIAAILLVGIGIAMDFAAPSLLALLLMLSRMSGPVGEVQRGVQQLVHSLPAYARLMALEAILQPARVVASDTALSETGALVLDKVGFARGGRDVLHGFSLRVAPGAIVGIAGPSGVGKTTLLDLMAGILRPDTGQVQRAGTDGTGFANTLAYVGQDPVLGGRTLRESLAWSSGAEASEMETALRFVGAGALLQRIGGIDAPLGERGAMISGGERQRIGLARALLRRPALLLLDEALNALDAESEQDILAALAGLALRPTIVIVAHRPQAFVLCEQIIHLSRRHPPRIEEREQAPRPMHEVPA
ncbi:ABC-type multidrug transport system fused ATPase/permease subunit [Sphingomonas kyeonggiensis]|uniref:ATP-binding cassette domain-containing protein n=1 Tax=Sphingomonas kyeonggiensis TaxID=1268553 RepID=UPI002786C4F3|nr:ABC transporter ATP-binding protein [Sphingomonas kyeonggiensis]MDQ0251855.1 ABC-type multidrug transport system fused ATPase/permease subunit [Sphingomonas kyeonggiensis]